MEVLGYVQGSWDQDKVVPLDDEPWTDLTVTEQTAAEVLGFDEETTALF